jgi:hypothetical protein
MMLLIVSIIVFLVVIGLIFYANMPRQCGQGCGGCPQCPCRKCGMPRKRCGCGSQGGCPFC